MAKQVRKLSLSARAKQGSQLLTMGIGSVVHVTIAVKLVGNNQRLEG